MEGNIGRCDSSMIFAFGDDQFVSISWLVIPSRRLEIIELIKHSTRRIKASRRHETRFSFFSSYWKTMIAIDRSSIHGYDIEFTFSMQRLACDDEYCK